MADRRSVPKPSKADAALLARIKALETAVEQLRAELDAQRRSFLEALARLPGARGTLPPPKP